MAVETVSGPLGGVLPGPTDPGAATSATIKRSISRRYAAERRFRIYGVLAILFGLAFLAVLFGSIVKTGYTAFVQSSFKLDVFIDRTVVDPSGQHDHDALMSADYTLLAKKALAAAVGAESASKTQMREVGALLSRDVDVEIRKAVLADPSVIGKTVPIWVLASGRVNSLLKGQLDRNLPASTRKLSDQQVAWIDKSVAAGTLAKRFNTGLFTNGASSNPETAGIGVAMVGSLFMMMTVLFLAVPLGVAAAVYLEEFARKNFWTDLIEVNINNLAAVPSIVFGLLGLAIFINFAGLPRSASIVGGLVLTLMTLPTIIIATRAAIGAVPPSIREAALGVGASKMQTITHHVRAAGDARHSHRYNHRPRQSPGRDGAAADDRHGGLRRRIPDIADGAVDCLARADLYVGHLGRARFRRTYVGRRLDPAGGAYLHEPFRCHSAPQVRAAVVKSRFPLGALDAQNADPRRS